MDDRGAFRSTSISSLDFETESSILHVDLLNVKLGIRSVERSMV